MQSTRHPSAGQSTPETAGPLPVRDDPGGILRRTGWAAGFHGLFLGLLLAVPAGHAAAFLEGGTAVGLPGTTVRVPVRLRSDTPVVAGEFEVRYQSPYLDVEPAEPGSGVNTHRILSAVPSSGTQRVVVYSLVNQALQNGTLVELPFQVAANAPEGGVSVVLTNAQFVRPNGSIVDPVSLSSGALTVSRVAPATFTSINRTESGLVELVLSGTPGEPYVIQFSSALGAAWTNLSTNVATDGVIRFEEKTAVNGAPRYYRAVADP